MDNNTKMTDFLSELSSAAPTPGGGGVAALAGALSAALCSMVANLTTGKKKYAEYQKDIERIIEDSRIASDKMFSLINKDAQCFEPLSKAYSIPKEDPTRAQTLENALKVAASCPCEILDESLNIIALFEELCEKGSRLALSDVGVAATLCESTIKSSLLNIYINTKLMSDKEYAAALNSEYEEKATAGIQRCAYIYNKVQEAL